jgi:geranylgeranyl diphosphate synthase type II
MEDLRAIVLEKMESCLKRNFGTSSIFGILKDYPSRPGKMLRPIICVAACGAVGGEIENAVNTATALELVHNAFLIKDDVVDASDFRRGKETLNHLHGMEIALNAGDALKVLSLSVLLDNLQLIGVRKSLQVMVEFLKMARMSVEGQLMELDWVKKNRVDLTQRDYSDMCLRKSSWYTVIAPSRTGITIGLDQVTPEQLDNITDFGTKMGIAFQIRDDLLNLLASFREYGKEINGDILEGKRTVMMIHLLENCSASEKRMIEAILKKGRRRKKDIDVNCVRDLMDKYGSITYAQDLSTRNAKAALKVLVQECGWMTNRYWKNQLRGLVDYVVARNK